MVLICASTVEFIFAWKSLKDGKLVKTGLREIRPIMVHDEFTKQTWPVECIPENAMCDTYVEFGSLQRKWNLHHIAVSFCLISDANVSPDLAMWRRCWTCYATRSTTAKSQESCASTSFST